MHVLSKSVVPRVAQLEDGPLVGGASWKEVGSLGHALEDDTGTPVSLLMYLLSGHVM